MPSPSHPWTDAIDALENHFDACFDHLLASTQAPASRPPVHQGSVDSLPAPALPGTRGAGPSPDDLCEWPDGTSCLRCELGEYGFMSDDYQVHAAGSPRWCELTGLEA